MSTERETSNKIQNKNGVTQMKRTRHCADTICHFSSFSNCFDMRLSPVTTRIVVDFAALPISRCVRHRIVLERTIITVNVDQLLKFGLRQFSAGGDGRQCATASTSFLP